MTRSSAEGPGAPIDHALRDLLDDQHHRDAVARRRLEHGLHQQATEAGTLAGILLDLGEREQQVSVSTTAGRTATGAIRTLGADFIGLRSPAGRGALIALHAITVVRAEPGATASLGDRLLEVEASLRDLLATLASERPWISVHTAAGEGLAGELRAVGVDALTLALAEGSGTAHVALGAVCEVVLP